MSAPHIERGAIGAPDLPPALVRGTALGRFMVLGLVGRGGMGEVYGAYDPDLDRKIAIKLLRSRADDAGESRTRLMREAKATAKISHPNVIVIYDTGTFEDRVFIAMEFIEGHTLRFWLQSHERTWLEVMDVFIAAGRGLAAAHERNLVHRDFKPDNVMIASRDGQVRVMDFGLARIIADREATGRVPPVDLDATMELARRLDLAMLAAADEVTHTTMIDKLTATGAVIGTPAYMSPEQFRSQDADARSDQFSFCVALYEALYGERPFAGRSLPELAANVVAGRVAEPAASRRVPGWIRQVLSRGLKAEPGERFPSMAALLDELVRNVGAGRNSFANGAAAKLAGLWEAPVGGRPVETPEKEFIRQAFLATGKPYAAAAFTTASAVLDRYAQRWTDLYIDVCEATHVRGEQSAEVLDLRMAYLNESLEDLKALCRLFREPTGQVVENAVRAADALGTLERCNDVKLLRAIVRPPDDPVTRAAVEQLRQSLVEVRALQGVGSIGAGLQAIRSLADRARSVGYGPVLAEILMVHGYLEFEFSLAADPSVLAIMEEAFAAAELARHDEVAAAAAIYLLFVTGYVQERADVAHVWGRYAETLLQRLGGHDLLWSWFFNNRGAVRGRQGRLAEAIDDVRRAIEAKQRALGPTAPDVAISLTTLGSQLAHSLQFVDANAATKRAMEILDAALGPEHPERAKTLATRAQILFRSGHRAEARQCATESLVVLERDTNPRGLAVTIPMRTLALCHLAEDKPEEALPLLERAADIRESLRISPLWLAEIHVPLGLALYARRKDRPRGLALIRQAREEYRLAAVTPLVARDIAELDAWMAAHEERPSKKPAAKPRTKPRAKRK